MPPGAPAEDQGQLQGAHRILRARPRQNLERQDDETVSRQKRERLGVGAVHRRLSAADLRVVETGHVVMDEARAVDELQRRGRRVRDLGPVVPAGRGDGQKNGGPDPRAAGRHRIGQGRGEPRRRAAPLPDRDRSSHRRFDPSLECHALLLVHAGV